MRKVIIAILAVSMMAVTLNDDGTCVEDDGTEGIMNGTGECITPAEYDILFGYDNLSTIPTQNPFDGDTTVAEVAGLTSDSEPASDRPREFGGQELYSFGEVVYRIHNGLMFL